MSAAGGGHQLRRHGLVAAADQHRGIHRLRGQHRLGVERGEVAVVHRGREQRRLAERHGGEGQRQAAGRQHAALHRLDQLGDRAVAVVEVRSRYRRCRPPACPASPANSPSTWRTTGADTARSRGRRNWRCCGPGPSDRRSLVVSLGAGRQRRRHDSAAGAAGQPPGPSHSGRRYPATTVSGYRSAETRPFPLTCARSGAISRASFHLPDRSRRCRC